MERLTIWNEQTEMAELIDWDTEEWKEFMSDFDVPVQISLGVAIDKLAHYEDLEEQGLLLITPCKLGDKFYRVNWNNEVEEYKVSCLTQKADGSFKIRVTRLRHGSVHDIIPKEIGETYFLTKEEAEAKLKELENE